MQFPQLWEALKRRLDRDLAVGTPTGSSSGDDSDSSSEDQSQSSSEEGGRDRQNAARGQQPTAVPPASGFQFFGSVLPPAHAFTAWWHL
jgi:hypothetical protein